MAKKVGIHRGRTNAKGVAFSANHQDRNFNVGNAEHIDPSLVRKNVYIKFESEVDKGSHQKMDDYEQAVYEKYLGTALEMRNEKQIANRHKDRVQTMEQFRRNPKFCPEEAIYTIGKFGDTVDPEIIKECFDEFIEWHKTHFPNVILLDAALHLDEPNAAPHIHNRQFWVVERTDENGQTYLDISQKEALAAMEIERPDTTKKEGRYNNAKMTYTVICREKWIEIAESHGIEIEREPQDKGLSGLTLAQLKAMTAKKETEEAKEELENIKALIPLVKQQLQKMIDDKHSEISELDEQIADKRSEIKDLNEQIIDAVEIPPRPIAPTPPPPVPLPPMKFQVFSKAEEKEYNESRKVYERAVKQYDKDLKKYHDEYAEYEVKAAKWDNQFGLVDATKKAADKVREAAARERRAQQAQQLAQAELERGRAENEKGKCAIQKREQELNLEVERRTQERLEKTDDFQRLMQTSSAWEQRVAVLHKNKGSKQQSEKATDEKVKPIASKGDYEK